MEFTTLVSVKNEMAKDLPFWGDILPKNLPEGSKVLALPPNYASEAAVDLNLEDKDVDYFVLVGADAKVVLRERGVLCKSTQVYLAAGAEVAYYCDEHTNDLSGRGLNRRAYLRREAKIDWYGAFLNQDDCEMDVQSFLVEEGAESNMNFLVLAKGKDQVSFIAQNNFEASNVKGEILVKTVATDQAQVKIVGGIMIGENARGTDSYLKEENLLLDKRARIRALPCLEIKINDVKAGHGATVTTITAEDMFYLRSRGMDENEAREFLIKGFLESALLKGGAADYISECLAKIQL